MSENLTAPGAMSDQEIGEELRALAPWIKENWQAAGDDRHKRFMALTLESLERRQLQNRKARGYTTRSGTL